MIRSRAGNTMVISTIHYTNVVFICMITLVAPSTPISIFTIATMKQRLWTLNALISVVWIKSIITGVTLTNVTPGTVSKYIITAKACSFTSGIITIVANGTLVYSVLTLITVFHFTAKGTPTVYNMKIFSYALATVIGFRTSLTIWSQTLHYTNTAIICDIIKITMQALCTADTFCTTS